MRFLQSPQKSQQTKNNNTGKRMPGPGSIPSFVEKTYACGDGTPGNDKCFAVYKLKKPKLAQKKQQYAGLLRSPSK